MKKTLLVILSAATILSGCAVEPSSAPTTAKDAQVGAESSAEETTTQEAATEAPPEKKSLSIAEFDELLSGQPLSITKTEYRVQDEQYKAIYPDMLSTVLQNNTDSDIKNALIGIVAWDSNNLPIKLKGSIDFSGGEYFKEVSYSDINLVSGTSFGEDSGYSISEECKVASFKSIVLSFETFEGDSWENPYVKDFRDAFEGKKFADDITFDIDIKDTTFVKSESSGENSVDTAAADALDAVLASQPLIVTGTNYAVQDENYKSLYPDLLQAILQNNTEADIREAVVAFVAWDANGLPVKIKGYLSFTEPAYVAKVNFSDINLVPGGTYGDSQGYSLDESCEIASFKAIVVSYTGFDDKTWENPEFKEFCNLYEGKRLAQ